MMSQDETVREAPVGRRAMMSWNVLAAAKDHEQGRLARRLKRLGDFRWSPYLGVLMGRVEDHQAFFDQLRRSEETEPGFLLPLARVVPLDKTVTIDAASFVPTLRAEVLNYADQIGSGSFYVRVERRGHKGEIHGQQLEQELDHALIESLTQRGFRPRVDFKNPDVIIAIETVGDECGIGIITKSLREQYPFVKVP
ncbi:MAG TPA: THUMP domain-containing protein [Nitrospiraceae bacterium]|nr:THUMP domain-containing protein [Nitrospiraceae bacterium]